MKPAPRPRQDLRLLVVDCARQALRDARPDALPTLLGRGDLVVLNDAATLPAALRGDGVEARLCGRAADGSFRAVVFGAGDYRTPTERRPAPPVLRVGDTLVLAGLRATVRAVDPDSARLVQLAFDARDGALWRALYAGGRPIQYAHVREPLRLAEVQTGYAARPWAAEMPSAGRPLSWEILLALLRRGIGVATLTHAAGLSATGDPALDARLPLTEQSEIPETTAHSLTTARRVLAIGTTVVRALEGASGRPGTHEVELVIGPGYRPRFVDALLTGIHEPGSSHLALLRAFAPPALLDRAYRHADAAGYLGHEFGDAMLLLGPKWSP
jgi:S-adenosylmethionine:tRNA ribosyltransferase-isomerase